MKCYRNAVIALFVVAIGGGSTFGASIYVAWYGSDVNGNGSYSNPFKTIGKGMTTSVHGDTVKIFAGEYGGEGNRNLRFNGKSIVVTSEQNNVGSVVIDCGGTPNRGFVFADNETSSSVLQFVTIRVVHPI